MPVGHVIPSTPQSTIATITLTSNLHLKKRGWGGKKRKKERGWDESLKKFGTVLLRDEEIMNKSSEGDKVDIQNILEKRDLSLCMANITTASYNILAKILKELIVKIWTMLKIG